MLTYEYPLGVKREIISSLRPYFGVDYPDPEWANKIRISAEWPQTAIHFPTIYIAYVEGPIRNAGLGHVEYGYNDNYEPTEVKHYLFDGRINFNVLSLSRQDTDKIAGGLINLLAFSDVIEQFNNFREEMTDEDYVLLVPNFEVITPHGENTAPVPWDNPDEMIYASTYSVPVHGEFYSDVSTGTLIEISSVQAWPYRPGEQPHWTP